jgi:hypothetical protein
MEQLKIGDRIYQENYNEISCVFTVERVTKTLAICNHGAKFKREYSKTSWITTAGDTGKWNTNHYQIETPQLKEKLYRQVSISKIIAYKFDELSTEKIKSIMYILNN